jgi:hypothetical protein
MDRIVVAEPVVFRSIALAMGLMTVGSSCRSGLMQVDAPEPDQIESTVFLIGDAGEPDPREVGAPLDSLTVLASAAPQRTLIVFLGDNVYPEGVPEMGHAEWADARRRLEAQVSAVPAGARAIFVPGNHDWADEKAFGLYSLRLQEQMIAQLAQGKDVRMLPGNGCPGPVSVDMGRLRFIALDTQWWLHNFIVRDSASRCVTTVQGVTNELRRQANAGEGRVVVVGGHHPLMTGGEHGGYCGISGPFRRLGGFSQDVMSGPNRTLRDSLDAALRPTRPLVYAAGHDHNLQVLRGGTTVRYSLVSGAGSAAKVSCAVRLRESYYTSQNRIGFIRLDVLRERGVLLRVYRYGGTGGGGVAFSRWLEPR